MANVNLPPDFKEFLKLLNSHHVEYLLIGGYAAACLTNPQFHDRLYFMVPSQAGLNTEHRSKTSTSAVPALILAAERLTYPEMTVWGRY